jgi:hypothetical protein
VSYAVEPITNRLLLLEGSSLAHKDKECGLKGVFGIVVIREDTTANTPHHRAVSFNEGSKSHFIPMFDETMKQLSVGESSPIVQKHGPAKLLNYLAQMLGHRQRGLGVRAAEVDRTRVAAHDSVRGVHGGDSEAER